MVELPKTEEGLGFNVMGGKEQNSPIYISRIIPGGMFNVVVSKEQNSPICIARIIPGGEFNILLLMPNSTGTRFFFISNEFISTPSLKFDKF